MDIDLARQATQKHIDLFYQLKALLLTTLTPHAHLHQPNQVTILSLADYSLTAETTRGWVYKYYVATTFTDRGYEYSESDALCKVCKINPGRSYAIGDSLRIGLCYQCINLSMSCYNNSIELDTGEHMIGVFSSKIVSIISICQLIGDKLTVYTMTTYDINELKSEYALHMTGKFSECPLCNTKSNKICLDCHKMMAGIYAREHSTTWCYLEMICNDGNVPNDVINYIALFIIEVIIRPTVI